MIVRANRADGSIQSSNGVNVDELRALVLRQLPEERAEAVLTRFDNDRRGLLETVSKRAPSIAIAAAEQARLALKANGRLVVVGPAESLADSSDSNPARRIGCIQSVLGFVPESEPDITREQKLVLLAKCGRYEINADDQEILLDAVSSNRDLGREFVDSRSQVRDRAITELKEKCRQDPSNAACTGGIRAEEVLTRAGDDSELTYAVYCERNPNHLKCGNASLSAREAEYGRYALFCAETPDDLKCRQLSGETQLAQPTLVSVKPTSTPAATAFEQHCRENPTDPKCKDDSDVAQRSPEDEIAARDEFCRLNPKDIKCTDRDDSDIAGGDDSTDSGDEKDLKTFCLTNPNDLKCAGSSGTSGGDSGSPSLTDACKKDPTNPKCTGTGTSGGDAGTTPTSDACKKDPSDPRCTGSGTADDDSGKDEKSPTPTPRPTSTPTTTPTPTPTPTATPAAVPTITPTPTPTPTPLAGVTPVPFVPTVTPTATATPTPTPPPFGNFVNIPTATNVPGFVLPPGGGSAGVVPTPGVPGGTAGILPTATPVPVLYGWELGPMIDTDSLYQSPYDVGVTVGITTARAQCPAGYAVVGAHYTMDRTTFFPVSRVRDITLACKAIDIGTPTDGIKTGSVIIVSNGSSAPSSSPVHAPENYAAIGVFAGVRALPDDPYLKGFSVRYRHVNVDPEEFTISVSGNPFEDVEVTHVAGPTSGGSGGNIDMEDCSAPTYAGSFENRTQMNVLVGFGVHRYSVIAVDGNLRIGGIRQLCQSILRVELE